MTSTDSVDNKKSGLLDKETVEKFEALGLNKNLNKITVELSNDEIAILKQLADDKGISANLALRRAIADEYYIRSQLKQRFRVLLQSPDKQLYEVDFK